MRTSSQINKSETKTKCFIDVNNLDDKTNNPCYFVIFIRNGEFVQRERERRSISHQQSVSNYQKRDTISTCPSDIASVSSDMSVLNVIVVNKKKVLTLS